MPDDNDKTQQMTKGTSAGRKGSRLQELLARLPLPGAEGVAVGIMESDERLVHDIDLLQLHMGGRDFLLSAKEVAEIVRPMPLTPVPMAPDHLLGVGNVHGQIVCVVEPGRMMTLPLPPARDGEATRYVVLRHARMRVALRVDSVPAIHRVPEAVLDDVSGTDVPVLGVQGWLELEGVRYDMLDARALLQE